MHAYIETLIYKRRFFFLSLSLLLNTISRLREIS